MQNVSVLPNLRVVASSQRDSTDGKLLTVGLYFIMLYGLSTMFYSLIPSSLPLNNLFVLGLIFCVAIIYCRKLRVSDIFLILVVTFWGVWTSAVSKDLSQNLSDYINIGGATLLAWKITSSDILPIFKDVLKSKKKILHFYEAIVSFIVLIELGMRVCYVSKASWGSASYFIGFSQSNHTWASCLCLFCSLFLFSKDEHNVKLLDIFCLGVLSLGILQTGARIFVVGLALPLFFYFRDNVNKSNFRTLIIPIAIIAVTYLVLSSNMIKKFDFLSTAGSVNRSYSATDTFTSGRTVFWEEDLDAYSGLPFYEQLLGSGFDYIYSIANHSGHNDFLHTLLGIGLFGALIYTLSFLRGPKTVWMIARNRIGMAKYYWIFIAVFFYVPFFLNGMFGYIHYLFAYFLICAYCISRDPVSVKDTFENEGIS